MPEFDIVKAPGLRNSRMPRESQLFLKALLGLKEGVALRLKCKDHNEAFRTSKALARFIYDRKKSGKLDKKFSVLRRKAEDNNCWFVFVVKKSQVSR